VKQRHTSSTGSQGARAPQRVNGIPVNPSVPHRSVHSCAGTPLMIAEPLFPLVSKRAFRLRKCLAAGFIGRRSRIRPAPSVRSTPLEFGAPSSGIDHELASCGSRARDIKPSQSARLLGLDCWSPQSGVLGTPACSGARLTSARHRNRLGLVIDLPARCSDMVKRPQAPLIQRFAYPRTPIDDTPQASACPPVM